MDILKLAVICVWKTTLLDIDVFSWLSKSNYHKKRYICGNKIKIYHLNCKIRGALNPCGHLFAIPEEISKNQKTLSTDNQEIIIKIKSDSQRRKNQSGASALKICT